jgi:hypothetical protein
VSRKLKEPFVRIVVSAPRHPKLLRVPPAARWLLVAAACYCRERQTDGLLARDGIATLGVDKPWPLVAALVAAGLLEEVDGGYRVHDYAQWQETNAEIAERRANGAKRSRDYRETHADD